MPKPKNCSSDSSSSAIHAGRIEFIYEKNCPNIADAREQLRLALEQAGMPVHWQEWEHSDPKSPAYARRYGSPSVLVESEDVAGEPESSAAPSCRIYTNAQGRSRGVPDAGLIRAAIQRQMNRTKTSPPANRLQIASLLPAVGAALLPKLTCPVCWPAYAALLSALGVSFIDYTPYLLPLTLVFLVVTLAILAWRPRRGYAPLALGLFAAAALLIGKFGFNSEIATYAGVAILVGASVWNAWPKQSTVACDNS